MRGERRGEERKEEERKEEERGGEERRGDGRGGEERRGEEGGGGGEERGRLTCVTYKVIRDRAVGPRREEYCCNVKLGSR